MKQAVVYQFRWHVPVEDKQVPGGQTNDFTVAGIDGNDPVQLRRESLSLTWPVGTIFQISRSTGRGRSDARCFLDQIRAWRPSLDGLPRTLPLDIPRSRSLDRMIFLNLLAKALAFGVEQKLSTQAQARECKSWILKNMTEPI